MNISVYKLFKSGTVVYIATTEDATRQEFEEKHDGKIFDHMEVTDVFTTDLQAKAILKRELSDFCDLNNGQMPVYNILAQK